MWSRKPKIALNSAQESLKLLRSIRGTLTVSMWFLAIIAGSTCDVGGAVDLAERLIEEQDEAEADRTMDEGVRV